MKMVITSLIVLALSGVVQAQTIIYKDGSKLVLEPNERVLVVRDVTESTEESMYSDIFKTCAAGYPTGLITFQLIEDQQRFNMYCDDVTNTPWCDVVDNEVGCTSR